MANGGAHVGVRRERTTKRADLRGFREEAAYRPSSHTRDEKDVEEGGFPRAERERERERETDRRRESSSVCVVRERGSFIQFIQLQLESLKQRNLNDCNSFASQMDRSILPKKEIQDASNAVGHG